MPFRKIKRKDEKTGKDVLDDNGDPIYDDEKFLPNFLGNTTKEADTLYNKYKNTLTGLANKYAMYSHVDEGDLVQEGVIGLARAAREFDVERSSDFNTFAIYKIKDAMREFISKQATDVKIPQYIKEASRLIAKLSKLIDKVSPMKESDYEMVWAESSLFDNESEIIKDINAIRDSLSNLAARSGTTIDQLLERAEMYPADVTDVDDVVYSMGDMSGISIETAEDDIITKIMTEKAIDKLMTVLSKEDYELLYAHYVDGKTVRELGPIYGISAPTMTIRIQNILQSLQKKKEQILMS